MRITPIVLSLLMAFVSGGATAQEAGREIVVVGEGRVSAEPDMAILSLGVTREARTASEAMSGASVATARILEDIGAAGIEARDVQTTAINLSPRWDHSENNAPPRVTGYVASNNLSIRVRDLDRLGTLLDSVIGSGANTMNGLTFSVSEPRPLQDEARVAAVKDAMSKAGLLAEAAEVTLGPIQTLTEVAPGGPGRPMMQGRAMMEAAVPIATGEVDITVTVTVVFAIRD